MQQRQFKMKLFRFFTPLVCILCLAGCKESATTAMTPRIPVYNSQGIPGPEDKEHQQDIFGHPVIVKDGWLQPWMNYDTLMVWSHSLCILPDKECKLRG